MNKIKFNKSQNLLINNGIVALYLYLQKFKDYTNIAYTYQLTADYLEIESDALFQLLEDVYYFMGDELYNTETKSDEKKYYFVKEPFEVVPFSKMKTYGFAALITNDPAPIPKKEENAKKFEDIYKKDKEFAKKIAEEYHKKGLHLKYFEFSNGQLIENKKQTKGDSKIYLNEPYIKITRLLPPRKEYFEPGEKICFITGEKYKKLVNIQNTLPFISYNGLDSFKSHRTNKAFYVSWKAMYLIRFSPKLVLYSYITQKNKKTNDLVCYFYDSTDLKKLYEIYKTNQSIYLNRIENTSFRNFQVYEFKNLSKNNENISRHLVLENELFFALIYTIYKNFLIAKETSTDSSFFDLDIEDYPISLSYCKAVNLSGNYRPILHEEFDNFKYSIRLIKYLEHNQVNFKDLFSYLILPDENDYQRYKLRDNVFHNLLYRKSIIDLIEKLLYKYFLLPDKNKFKIRYINFYEIINLLKLYEFKINKTMEKELQELALNVGNNIGYTIKDFSSDTDSNIKSARKYIISLHKSRTIDQFNESLIRIMNKYGITINQQLLKAINKNNFILVKQYLVIGILNILNSNYSSDKSENNKNQ